MQIAINPNIYETAQIYAERKGLNLTAMIENFLVQLTTSISEPAKKERRRTVKITPTVARLRTGHSWNMSDDEVDKIRYEYLLEKYK
jgi:hypothetical protein